MNMTAIATLSHWKDKAQALERENLQLRKALINAGIFFTMEERARIRSGIHSLWNPYFLKRGQENLFPAWQSCKLSILEIVDDREVSCAG